MHGNNKEQKNSGKDSDFQVKQLFERPLESTEQAYLHKRVLLYLKTFGTFWSQKYKVLNNALNLLNQKIEQTQEIDFHFHENDTIFFQNNNRKILTQFPIKLKTMIQKNDKYSGVNFLNKKLLKRFGFSSKATVGASTRKHRISLPSQASFALLEDFWYLLVTKVQSSEQCTELT